MSEETNDGDTSRSSPGAVEADVGFSLPCKRPAALMDDMVAEPLHKRLRLTDKADRYCWICNDDTPGKSSLLCDMCPRLFHCKCLGLASVGHIQQWICPECEKILRAECPMTRSRAMKLVTGDELCKLLKYALERARTNVNAEFLRPVDAEQVPQYKEFVVFPCDVSTIEKNIDQKLYACTEAFMADVKWIQHNSTIFNGPQHSLTTNARSLVRQCKREVKDIEVCPECYKNVFANPLEADWFCQPCKDPHPLVWAKLKGYPFWPAKALREADGVLDVRFFGAHDRAWVSLSHVYLLSKECPGPVKGRKSGFDDAMRELELHIEKLREKYGRYEYAPPRTPYASTPAGSIAPAAPSASPSIAGSQQQQQPKRKRAYQRNSGTAVDAAAATKVCLSKSAAVDGIEAVPHRSRRITAAKAPAASPRSSRTQRLASKHHLFIKHSLNGGESGRSEADGGDESRSPTAGPVGLEGSLVDVGDRAAASPALSAGSEAESSQGGDMDLAAADECDRSSSSVQSVPSASRGNISLSLLTPGCGDCSTKATGRAVVAANGEAASLITEQLAGGGSKKRDECVSSEGKMNVCPAEGDASREAHAVEEKAGGARKSLLRQCSELRPNDVHASAAKATADDCALSLDTPSSCSTALRQTSPSPMRSDATEQRVASKGIDDPEAEKLLGDAGSVPLLCDSTVDVGNAVARNMSGGGTAATAAACDAFETPVPSPSGWSLTAAGADPQASKQGLPHTETIGSSGGSSDSSSSVSGRSTSSSSCRRRASADSAEPVSEGAAAVPIATAMASSFAPTTPEQQPPPAKLRRTSAVVVPAGVAEVTGERRAMGAVLEKKNGEESDNNRVENASGEDEEASVGSDRSSEEPRSSAATAVPPPDLAGSSAAAEAVGKNATTNGPADTWFDNLEKTIKDVRAQLYGDGHQSFEQCDESGSEDDEDDDRRSSSQSETSVGNAVCERFSQSPPGDSDTAQRPADHMDVITTAEAPVLSIASSLSVVNEKCQPGDTEIKQEAFVTVTKGSSAPGRNVLGALSSSFSAARRKETDESAQPASELGSNSNGDVLSPIPVAGLSETLRRLMPTTVRSVLSLGGSIVTKSEPSSLLPPLVKHSFVASKLERASSSTGTTAVASARVTEEQLEELRSQHRRSVNSLKHNGGLLLEEVRKMAEQDKLRALAKAKRQADERMQKAVEETKCKQWCANCHREAQLFCCWNTSYCDYPCQQLHWTQHMQTCHQVSPQQLADAIVGYADCDENEGSNHGDEIDESVNPLTEAVTTIQPGMPSSMVRSSAAAVAAQTISSAVMQQRGETPEEAAERLAAQAERARHSRQQRRSGETPEDAAKFRAAQTERTELSHQQQRAEETAEEAAERGAAQAESARRSHQQQRARETQEEAAERRAEQTERTRRSRLQQHVGMTPEVAAARRAAHAERMRLFRMRQRNQRLQSPQKQLSAGSSRRANGELLRSEPEPLSSADGQRSIKVQAGSSVPGDRSSRQSSAGTSESSLKLPPSGLVGVTAPGRTRTLLTPNCQTDADTASVRHQASASVAGVAARHSSLSSETVVATSKQHAARGAAANRHGNTITFGFPLTSRATVGSSSPSTVRSSGNASGPSPSSSAVRSSSTLSGPSPASSAARSSGTASGPASASIVVRSNSSAAAAATHVPLKAELPAETSRSPAASATRATTIPMPYFRVHSSHRPVAGQTRLQPSAVGDQPTARGSQQSSAGGR